MQDGIETQVAFLFLFAMTLDAVFSDKGDGVCLKSDSARNGFAVISGCRIGTCLGTQGGELARTKEQHEQKG
jgi:hypothetical protein